MNSVTTLSETISRHSQALFGVELGASALQITAISRGTRSVYRVQAMRRMPTVIAKRRSFQTDAEREAASVETSHEFAVHSAVWTALKASGAPGHEVPRPLLAVPESGLLFMEPCNGEAVERFLRGWVVGLHSTEEVSRRISTCGEWRHTFSGLTGRIEWPVPSQAAVDSLRTRRARHHVYCLIGRSGRDLMETMAAEVRKRLTAYRIDSRQTARIEAAFARQFDDFGRSHDRQVAVHGKLSIADVLTHGTSVAALDLEQAGVGSVYLDAAYFLYQVYMVTRWRLLGSDKGPAARFRRAFLGGTSQADEIDEAMLDGFIAYYMVNSLRPAGGLAGWRARSYAHRWVADWLLRVGV